MCREKPSGKWNRADWSVHADSAPARVLSVREFVAKKQNYWLHTVTAIHI